MNWDQVLCECGHRADQHRERQRDYPYKDKVCDGGGLNEDSRTFKYCDCSKKKVEVVNDHFEARLSALENQPYFIG